MNPLKTLLLSLLTIFLLPAQNIFALNAKNIPSDVYTESTLPDKNNVLNYCELWEGYSPQYVTLELEISPPNWQGVKTVGYTCTYDDGRQKLVGNRWFQLKKEETKQQIVLKNKKIPNDYYTRDALPNHDEPLNYCEITGQYDVNKLIVDFVPYQDRVEFYCLYMGDAEDITAPTSIFTLKTQTQAPTPQIEGCTDSTAINYNPSANIHKESMCEYPPVPPVYTPQDITGSFEKSQVSIGATTWTIKFILNVPNATLDPSTIQTWNQFTAVDSTANDKTITLTLRQFDDQRLDVECTNYEITIPRHALTTTNGDTNPNPISGNFEVVGCPEKPQDQTDNTEDKENQNNQPKHENTIKENNFYLSLYDTDEKGKVYINLTNVIYILGFISFFLVLFFVLFGFIKNSFLGNSRKSYR